MPKRTLSDAFIESVLLRAQLSNADEAVDQLLMANAYLPGKQELQSALLNFAGREDSTYTKQYFTIGRQAHVRSTQSIGAPALVWHVGFWPKRGKDPQDLDGKPGTQRTPRATRSGADDGSTRPPTRDEARTTYNTLRTELAADLDALLRRLQRRGRVPGADGQVQIECFGEPEHPSDWETRGSRPQTPAKAFTKDSLSFTLWWGDAVGGGERTTCPARPAKEDLRVRVQADIHPDFATVTFIIDAGKPWDLPAFDVESDTAVPGERRTRIFDAVRTIRGHAKARLDRDPIGAEDLVPETGVSPDQAKCLLDASRLFYRDIWEEFSHAFDCRLTDIAGETDKVFANFRGAVLSTPGVAVEEEEKPHLERFVHGGRDARSNLDKPYPNAVVKAHWPFIRRTRSEADHRDWIACGVFDWRALYITALGGQSDFDPGDETEVREAKDADRVRLAKRRADTGRTSEVPSAYLPQRAFEGCDSIAEVGRHLNRMEQATDPEVRETASRLKGALKLVRRDGKDLDPRDLEGRPTTDQHDRPAPFHYLLLTTDKPHRRQVGRMVDRVNLLGTIRLYAMKNFSIIRDADVHLRIYGQLLDGIMSRATEETDKALLAWWREAYREATKNLKALWGERHGREIDRNKRLKGLHPDYETCIRYLEEEKAKLASGRAVSERPLMLYRRLLADMIEPETKPPKPASVLVRSFARLRKVLARTLAGLKALLLGPRETNVLEAATDCLRLARKAKSRHDEDMAQLNRQTDLRLHQVKTYIDELGRDAIGGLAFRINRARYYADMYRTMVRTLRVGSIDTWWDYEQLASRGVDPPLKFIENVGDRLEKLRIRLRDAMEAVQTSAIANQTEATRDNTFQLETIAGKISEIEANLDQYKRALERSRHRWRVLYILVLIAVALAGFYYGQPSALQGMVQWIRGVLQWLVSAL